MVKLKSTSLSHREWLAQANVERGAHDAHLLHTALMLIEGKNAAFVARGHAIGEVLFSLDLDCETLAAALIYPLFKAQEIHHDSIAEKFGDRVKKLLLDASQMQSLEKFKSIEDSYTHQIENLRKILLAMVTDIRAVIIILAERLVMLREAKQSSHDEQTTLAHLSLNIYAPLANRLGIWPLKWEIEDMSLRYLEPAIYKSIATGLANRRIEREEYIENAMQALNALLTKHQINNFNITGRIKHIYSIYNKMQRKTIPLEKMYDVSAMRVLVPAIEDCYTVMGIIHHTWQHIYDEFDDYISQPKPNGYQSIHTVIIGPDNKPVEIQIRTYEMHQHCELGVASHWSYKENIKTGANYEAKIALLRQVMAWQKDISADKEESAVIPIKELFSDRIYVFTPLGDIIDLPIGATPLDFAYAIHSEIGHRCRGAKVNGKLVQLTYSLQTGERVEIQTTKIAHPSRDWLNVHKGYIKTVRARSHIQHWFRNHESEETDGESTQKNVIPSRITKIMPKLKASLNQLNKPVTHNISNYLTKVSRCCKPLPGDTVTGYITQRAGLSVHRTNCSNFIYLKNNHPERVLTITFDDNKRESYPVELEITAHENAKLLHTITTALANANIHIIAFSEKKSTTPLSTTFLLTIKIKLIDELNKCVHVLNQISDIINIKRD